MFTEEFFRSNFWLYWRTMFAFETWHSALEMKLYLQRFIHHIGGLPDFRALKFTQYNQYESLILPLVHYLKEHNVQFQYDTQVTNVIFDIARGPKVGKAAGVGPGGPGGTGELTEDDLVFVTNGSCTENSSLGQQRPRPRSSSLSRWGAAGSCGGTSLPRTRPSAARTSTAPSRALPTGSRPPSPPWTTRSRPIWKNICKRDPRTGKVVTGGIVTVKDSAWMMSYTFNRQPHFKAQPEGQLVGVDLRPVHRCPRGLCEKAHAGVYRPGNLHGVAVSPGGAGGGDPLLAEQSASTIPCMMPYITAFFMPRTRGDRPDVIPDGCVNFAFLGQFADTPRDTVFTTEYSVRTGMEAVYTLLDIDRGCLRCGGLATMCAVCWMPHPK